MICKNIAFYSMFFVLVSQLIALAAETASQATEPSTKEVAALRRVEVTMGGRIGDVKGLTATPPNERKLFEASLSEPCELTIHLPSGKVLSMTTRPILFIGCPARSDVVTSVFAPPSGANGSLPDIAERVDRLLALWRISPTAQLLAELNGWKRQVGPGTLKLAPATLPSDTQPTTRISTLPTTASSPAPSITETAEAFERDSQTITTTMRISTIVDERTQISFRAQGAGRSGWNLVVEVSATPAEWERIRQETMHEQHKQ